MATVIGPSEGKAGFLGSIGVRFMIDGEDAGGDFSLVEHPLSARALAAPLHRHTREDEYSFVLGGRMGGLLGDGLHRGAGGAKGAVQLDGAFGDPLLRLRLQFGAALHLVRALFIGHICSANLDRRRGLCLYSTQHYCLMKGIKQWQR